jgi:hypothetical protein
MSEQQKRRSFRLSEKVHLEYEIISEREYDEGRALRNARLGGTRGLQSMLLDIDARLSERLYVLRASAGPAAECLALLNDKLDAVIAHLPELRQQRAALAAREPQACELSADGMTFGTTERVTPGTRLAVRFLLTPGHRYIETFATALRETPPPEPDEGHTHGVAVEFHGLEPSQREVIIRHLFSREAETLRARRQQGDGAVARDD